MKIYFCHSTGFDYKQELYDPIKGSGFYNEHQIVFPHGGLVEVFDTKEIIKGGDLIVAEVSLPSTGMGIELGWANDFGIPVVCIYKTGAKVSKSLNVISKRFIEYRDGDDLVNKLIKVLK